MSRDQYEILPAYYTGSSTELNAIKWYPIITGIDVNVNVSICTSLSCNVIIVVRQRLCKHIPPFKGRAQHYPLQRTMQYSTVESRRAYYMFRSPGRVSRVKEDSTAFAVSIASSYRITIIFKTTCSLKPYDLHQCSPASFAEGGGATDLSLLLPSEHNPHITSLTDYLRSYVDHSSAGVADACPIVSVSDPSGQRPRPRSAAASSQAP